MVDRRGKNHRSQPMRKLKIIATLCGCLMAATSGSGELRPALATYTFGLTLTTGMNNELFTLFVVKEFEGRVLKNEPLTRGQFVLQAQGGVPSNANPAGANLFRKYGVNSCLPPAELGDGRIVMTDCGVFDDLWKLRFWEYPFRQAEGVHPGNGWAETPNAPSPRQMLLLSDYGMLYMHSVVKGEDLFRLLRDMGDEEWVDNYRKGY